MTFFAFICVNKQALKNILSQGITFFIPLWRLLNKRNLVDLEDRRIGSLPYRLKTTSA